MSIPRRKYHTKMVDLDYVTLNTAIEILTTLRKQIEDPSAMLEINTFEEYGDPTSEVFVSYHTEETKAEKEARERDERAHKLAMEAEERRMYEVFKKKFGDA